MKKLFKKQNIFIIIAIVLLIGLTKVSAGSDSQLISVRDSGISTVGKETLEILLALKSLSIDEDFFDRPVFTQLVDFSIELEEKDKGRNNPFKDFIFDEDGDFNAGGEETTS
ncbi:MAG: hypothetical protein KAS02_01520 [Candidatus Pacebacteria bacterium]|nr:hypothetical protein [Candidatus Paceibacterota bacterium]